MAMPGTSPCKQNRTLQKAGYRHDAMTSSVHDVPDDGQIV
jgi:hypothetical protein